VHTRPFIVFFFFFANLFILFLAKILFDPYLCAFNGKTKQQFIDQTLYKINCVRNNQKKKQKEEKKIH
jgi:hypothetical protein